MKRKSILFIGISTAMGGAERSLFDFIKGYQKTPDAFDISVLLPHSSGPLVDHLQILNVKVDTLKMPSRVLSISRQHLFSDILKAAASLPAFVMYLFRLWLFVHRRGFAVIHTTGLKNHVFLCLLSPFLSARILLHWRDILPSKWLLRFFQFFGNDKNIVYLANSKATQNSLLPIHSTVVYNGVDIPEDNMPSHIHQQLKIPTHHRMVGIVGVLSAWKGQKQFILAAAEILKKRKDVHFLVIGGQIYDTSTDPEYKEELFRLASDLKIDHYVHFLGFIDNPKPLIIGLDLLVHASIKPEPFGRVLLEGFSCKTPVLAARAGGALEIITENETGYFHTPGDVKDLADKIVYALEDENRQRIIENAYDFLRVQYSIESYIYNLKKFIETSQ